MKSRNDVSIAEVMAGIPPVAYGYARVSTNRQKYEGYGEEAQIDTITAHYDYVLKRKGVLWGDVYTDDHGVSATTKSFAQRPCAVVLISRLRPGDHIIFSALDRAWRNMRDMVVSIHMLLEKGVTLHFARENLEIGNNSPSGMLIGHILGAIAEFESRMISERTKAAKRVMKEKYGVGGNNGILHPKSGKRDHNEVIAPPSSREMMILRHVKALLLEGMLPSKIVDHLRKNKIALSYENQLFFDQSHYAQRRLLLRDLEPGPFPHQCQVPMDKWKRWKWKNHY